jgi:hypothetical protein
MKGNNKISYDASRDTKSLLDYYDKDSKDPDDDKDISASPLERLTEVEEEIFSQREAAKEAGVVLEEDDGPRETPRILAENPIVEKQEWVPSNPIEVRFKCPIQYVVALKREVAEWKARGWC